MFFLTQYIEIIKNQFALYDGPASGPSETTSGEYEEELSLDKIDTQLSDLAKATKFPKDQLQHLLAKVEKLIDGMTEAEKIEDKKEIDRILGRIDFLRKELWDMRDEAESIAGKLGDGENRDTGSEDIVVSETEDNFGSSENMMRTEMYGMQLDIRALKEKRTPNFEAFISSIAQREGISQDVLDTIIGDRFNFTDFADEGEESEIAQKLLDNPQELESEILELIKKWKESQINLEGEKALEPDNIQGALEFFGINGSQDPVGDMMRVIETNNSDKPKSFLRQILEMLAKLLGVELDSTDDTAQAIFGASRERLNPMLTQGGKMNELGSLSEFYESGGKGPEAINGNDVGMPSFGTYQLRADFLKKFADQHGIAGDHTKTFTKGNETEFAKNWLAKVQEIGIDKFKQSEHNFIKETHYDVTVANLGIDITDASMVLKNVIWSASVQHGPHTKIIKNAFAQHPNIKLGERDAEEKLIKTIYALRGESKNATKQRYEQEQRMALSQLRILPGRLVDIQLVGDIRSVQKEVVRNPDGSVKMTYCARTARLNAERFGVTVPQEGSASKLENNYRQFGRLSSSNRPSGNVFQIFSRSNRFPQHGHVATGFVRNGQAFVLDPYLPATGTWTHNPIPLQTYLGYLQRSGRGFNGIANIG